MPVTIQTRSTPLEKLGELNDVLIRQDWNPAVCIPCTSRGSAEACATDLIKLLRHYSAISVHRIQDPEPSHDAIWDWYGSTASPRCHDP